MLQGKFGCGKTVVMETFSTIHNHIVNRFEVQRPLINQTLQYFVLRPLIIDEFGREPKTIQDFGNILRPISELLSLRSDNGSITHGTTNFVLKTLGNNDNYGGMIGDRLKMMFNFITMEGDSRRI